MTQSDSSESEFALTGNHERTGLLQQFGVDVWVFTTDNWIVREPAGDYVERERKTIQAEPTVVVDFAPHFAHAAKIVGSSTDFALLVKCEAAMREVFGGQASIARSQPYYLDVTPPGLDKGTFIEALSKRLAIGRTSRTR